VCVATRHGCHVVPLPLHLVFIYDHSIMLALVYLEGLAVALLTVGYAVAASIGMASSSAPAWREMVAVASGAWGFVSLWWLLVTTIILLQTNRRYALPAIVKAGAWPGFLFALFIVVFPMLDHRVGNGGSPHPIAIVCFVALPCAIAVHLVYLMRVSEDVESGNAT
jgi:hypothetical protein